MNSFKLKAPYPPAGDQPYAIEKLLSLLEKGERYITLLGATGTGKTYTIAHVIEKYNKPTLVISHNKTLAYQLYNELKSYFPENAVEYFVSYYDYYQPEAYLPETDTYIEKETAINDLIDRLRLKATSSLIMRRDVIVVASVSCIYGLGSPELYKQFMLVLEKEKEYNIREILSQLVDMQYQRKDFGYDRGTFVIKGDIVEIFPAYEEIGIRLTFWGDFLEDIEIFEPLTNYTIEKVDKIPIFPAKHFMTNRDTLEDILQKIEIDLKERVAELLKQGKVLEAQRLESRTRYDIEMIREIGYCNGIENYSRYFDGRKPGEPPATLIDFFPKDFLMIIDESHVTIPQIRGMYNGDTSRKQTLVEYGFRLPAALDNRPLKFDEFLSKISQVIFVSATPGDWELKMSGNNVVEQINRPTGLLDPEIEVRPTYNQIDDLISEINNTIKNGDKVIVITLTKKMAEDLTEYLTNMGIRAKYLHSELDTVERSEIIEDLKNDNFDVIVGINLLREGIDLPIVSLVAILDADKEGFLRSETSLIQIIGRAARHENGRVILYADRITRSMKKAIDETNRRRKIQIEFNKKYNITPKSIKVKKFTSLSDMAEDMGILSTSKKEYEVVLDKNIEDEVKNILKLPKKEIKLRIKEYEKKMLKASEKLEFEKAAYYRDIIRKLKENL